ncbi:MAG: NfeD family protein [Planctomycetota bacterium]
MLPCCHCYYLENGSKGYLSGTSSQPKAGGKVELHGTNWVAEADEEIAEGTVVEIIAKDNLTLEVKIVGKTESNDRALVAVKLTERTKYKPFITKGDSHAGRITDRSCSNNHSCRNTSLRFDYFLQDHKDSATETGIHHRTARQVFENA